MRLIPFHYAITALFVCTGLIAGFFVWYASGVYTDFDLIPRPVGAELGDRLIGGCSTVSIEATDPVSGVCERFQNSCDVPAGWSRGECLVASTTEAVASSSLSTPRESARRGRKPDPNIKIVP